MASKDWIKGAIRKPGAEKNAAQKAGMSTMQYAEKNDAKPGKAGKRARLAETLMKFRGKK